MRHARTYHAQSARAFSSVVPLQWQWPDLMLHLKLHHSSKLRQLSVPLHMKNQKPQANAGSSTMRKAMLSPANTKCAPSQPHRNLLLSINKPAQVQHPQGRRTDCGPTNPQLTAEPSGGLFPSKMPVARTLFWLFLVYFSFFFFFSLISFYAFDSKIKATADLFRSGEQKSCKIRRLHLKSRCLCCLGVRQCPCFPFEVFL